MYSFPMTANHEMAHQMGYASERMQLYWLSGFCENDNLHPHSG
jgi:hypothetical protein